VTLLAFIATPALLMAIILTRSPRKTLLLRMPRPAALPMAVLLAIVLHPAGVALAEGVRTLYPLSPEVTQQIEAIGEVILQARSFWSVLLVLAVMPALCEELAFRGFILSGLRHMGHKWAAILACSIFFGATHGILQQSLTACALGMIIGYVAVQTGSLLPPLLVHAVHNSLSLRMAWNPAELIRDWPALEWLVKSVDSPSGVQLVYHWPVVAASVILSAFLLLWFRSLPFEATAEETLQEALVRESRIDAQEPRSESQVETSVGQASRL
jgi:sodium transport system permease protein